MAQSQYTIADDNSATQKPKYTIEDDDNGSASTTPAPEPTFVEKAAQGKAGVWDAIKHAANPMSIPGDVSEMLGKVGDWAQKKSQEKEVQGLGQVAKGGQAPGYSAYTPGSGYDLLGRVAHMGSGATNPTNVAVAGATIAAPEIMGPALIAHGGYNAVKAGSDIADKGANPENVESLLTSGAEMAGGGASLGEIPKMGGLKNTLTGKAVSKVLKATGGAGLGLGLSPEDLITKGVRPRARAQGWQDAIQSPGVQRAIKEADAATPIKTIEDFHDAIGPMKEKLWNEQVQPALDRQGPRPVDMKPAAQRVRDAITPTMREFNPQGVAALEDLAGKLEKSRTVAEANELQKYANGQVETYHAKYPTARRAAMNSDPDVLGWETARQGIREQLNKTLEDAGETQTADARKDYGRLTAIEKELERKVNPNERKAPINLARTLGLIGAIPTHGASLAAGEFISHMNDPNVLLRRGIAKMNPPAAASFTPPEAFKPPAPPAVQQSLPLPPENAPLFNIQQTPKLRPDFEEPRLAPIHGEQLPLQEHAPFFDIQQTPKLRPDFEEPRLGAIHGEQQPLGLAPPEAPLFNIQTPNPRGGLGRIGETPGALVPPESSASSSSPIRPPGPRWTGDRGAMPGEPMLYLDGDSPETAKAAIVEEQDPRAPGRSTFDAYLPNGELLGRFGTAEEAARHAESIIPKEGEDLGTIGGPDREGALGKIGETKSVAPSPLESVKLPHPEPVDLKPGEATSDRFYDADKDEWSPEREANHESVAEAAIKGKTPPTGRPPEAIITMGGTAAGKTTLTRQILGADKNRVNIDSDLNKLAVPEYEGLKDSDPDNAAARVHEESKAISRRILEKTLTNGLDFIYDTTTGGGGEKVLKKLKDLGYKVRVVYADVPVEEAINRANERAQSSNDPTNRGRVVPEDVIRETHAKAAKAFDAIRKSPNVDEVRAFDTTTRTPEEFYRRSHPEQQLPDTKNIKVTDPVNSDEGEGWKEFYAERPYTPMELKNYAPNLRESASKKNVRAGMMIISPEGDALSIRLVSRFGKDATPGVGSALYRRAIEYARENGYKAIISDQEGGTTPDAAKIWRKLGAEETKGKTTSGKSTPSFKLNLEPSEKVMNQKTMDRVKEKANGQATTAK